MNIKGGYILQPRSFDESDIISCPPHVREIWLYLIRNANSSDVKHRGFDIKRGQLFRSYQDIRDALSWKVGYRTERYNENQTKMAMKFLRDTQRITTAKELGGVLITICNYDFYQCFQNYETTSEATDETTIVTPSKNHPLPTITKNKNNINITLPSNEVSVSLENPEILIPSEENLEIVKPEIPEKPKKVRKKKEKPESDAPTLYSRAREIFEARYHRETGERYYWTAKDAGNMSHLLNALKYQREQKGLPNTDDTEVLAAFSQFLNSAVKDEWIKKNLAVPILFSKFNEIIARAKEEQNQRNNRNGYTASNNGASAQSSGAAPKDYSGRF